MKILFQANQIKKCHINDREFAAIYLHAIEKKYQEYFTQANLSILNCVAIKGIHKASVHVVNKDLPPQIRYDIEEMFWVD